MKRFLNGAPIVSGLDCFGDLVRDNDTGLIFDHNSPNPDARLAEQIMAAVRR